MKKAFLIVAALTLILSASSVMAQGNLSGTFTGTMDGTWHATIKIIKSDETDIGIPVLDGVWTAYAEPYDGYLEGKGYIADGCYVFEEADVIFHDGELIGHWSGSIPYVNDAYFTGSWYTFDGGEGKWGGSWQ